MKSSFELDLGCRMPHQQWADFNRTAIFAGGDVSKSAPFPPKELMQIVSALTSERDFASHGADLWLALSAAAPKPLHEYASILDLGCGCGRLARMFKGYKGHLTGCDIYPGHVEWVNNNLPYMNAVLTNPDTALPFGNGQFELIISISVLTHLNEESQDFMLSELRRITHKDGLLLLTIHGERALERATTEEHVWNILGVDRLAFEQAQIAFSQDRHGFILQEGHLTDDKFQYGISLHSARYVQSHWGRYFDIRQHISGAIHDFQDILVLSPK